ncbi:hypothetical protein LCD36_06305 [Saccharopolyspora sp. 6T]|uniref:transporter substrate-binding domain-containing protein n=1 Tax=Saccharopolyspora sp. 6T TaxID=2877238 RepID=UPI001CD56E27|nr:hypothetical protein [Saccharopolyspora sp. 6T]MCA1186056.1 hypothetical protein [Saccharopolyspora sp. 6T]
MRTGVVAVVLAGGMALAGCSAGTGEPEQPPPSAPAPVAPPAASPRPGAAPPPPVELGGSATLEEVRQRGSLLVGLRAEEPRFATRDGSRYRGFDVEVAELVAQGLGLDPRTQISYRMLPPTLRDGSLARGEVDLLVGGAEPGESGVDAVGPYAVTADGTEHYLGIKSGDEALHDRITAALDAAVGDGTWQRAYDETLAAEGVQARPAPR